MRDASCGMGFQAHPERAGFQAQPTFKSVNYLIRDPKI